MPTQIIIPESRRRVCAPCEYHKCCASLHIRTGGGWREYVCSHPEAFEPSDHKVVIELQARAKAMDGGRLIGKTENQPEWCPLIREITIRGEEE